LAHEKNSFQENYLKIIILRIFSLAQLSSHAINVKTGLANSL
jgi:hypothetical protein